MINTLQQGKHYTGIKNHTAGEIKYSCELCEKTFSRKDYKDVHVFNCTNSHPTEKPRSKYSKQFDCKQCNKTCTQKENLSKHLCTKKVMMKNMNVITV